MAEKEMTKAERKAALKAAKAAAKEEAKNAANKKEGKKEDKPSDDKGNKKEKDKPSQVEKPAAEAPKDNKEQSQTPKKKKDKIPTIIPEDVSHENKPSPEEKALRRATSLVGGITGAVGEINLKLSVRDLFSGVVSCTDVSCKIGGYDKEHTRKPHRNDSSGSTLSVHRHICLG